MLILKTVLNVVFVFKYIYLFHLHPLPCNGNTSQPPPPSDNLCVCGLRLQVRSVRHTGSTSLLEDWRMLYQLGHEAVDTAAGRASTTHIHTHTSALLSYCRRPQPKVVPVRQTLHCCRYPCCCTGPTCPSCYQHLLAGRGEGSRGIANVKGRGWQSGQVNGLRVRNRDTSVYTAPTPGGALLNIFNPSRALIVKCL